MTGLIAVAGDWHADYEWAAACVRDLAERGVERILHVGDFGVGFGSSLVFVDPMEALLARKGITVYVTPGNHENYDIIETLPALGPQGDMPEGLLQLTPHILLMPRGYRWQMGGKSFVSLGGGNSIDKRSRVSHISWWSQESITLGDLMRVADGGEADVMITHVAPFAAKYAVGNGGWDFESVLYSDQSRVMMGQIVDEVKPKLFLHGHYHTDKVQTVTQQGADGAAYETTYVSFGRNRRRNNLALFEPSELRTQFTGWPGGVEEWEEWPRVR